MDSNVRTKRRKNIDVGGSSHERRAQEQKEPPLSSENAGEEREQEGK